MLVISVLPVNKPVITVWFTPCTKNTTLDLEGYCEDVKMLARGLVIESILVGCSSILNPF